jgi:hypothetical protein
MVLLKPFVPFLFLFRSFGPAFFSLRLYFLFLLYHRSRGAFARLYISFRLFAAKRLDFCSIICLSAFVYLTNVAIISNSL